MDIPVGGLSGFVESRQRRLGLLFQDVDDKGFLILYFLYRRQTSFYSKKEMKKLQGKTGQAVL